MVSTPGLRRPGATWIALGIAFCAVAVLVDLWEERNVNTISQAITLPALALLILGCGLGVVGYRRVLRDSAGQARAVGWGVGLGTGLVISLIAYAWQLAHGVYPPLLAYDAAVLLYGGIALSTMTVLEEPRVGLNEYSTRSVPAGRSWSFSGMRPACGVGMVVAAACLYLGFGYSLSWLNTQVTSVDPSYALLALEVLGSAAILLGIGYRSAIATWTRRRRAIGQLAGLAAGLALFASTLAGVYPAGLNSGLDFLMLNLLRVAGLLLVAAATFPFAARGGLTPAKPMLSGPDRLRSQ